VALRFRSSAGPLQTVLAGVGGACDVLVLAGDLTDRGAVDEAKGLARELSATVRVPIVAVLGNHDYESGCAQEVTEVLRDAGVHVLDGNTCEVHGVSFAGVKGFCGGSSPSSAPAGSRSRSVASRSATCFTGTPITDALRGRPPRACPCTTCRGW
jgi:predicted phosphohydrolase